MIQNNPFSLENKKILVTGASSGIGRSIAIECSKMGAKVYLTARNKERLEDTLKNMFNPCSHKIILADLSNSSDRESLINLIEDKLDGVVHCAGFTITKPFRFVSEEDISKIMNVNFIAPVFLTQRLLKKKKINDNSSIVFISSISGTCISYIAGAPYSASKGAINGIAKTLALELAPKHIRVNTVIPGMVDTNILNGVLASSQLEEDAKKYPLKRYGKPEEIAYGVIYLLSDASQWVTGTNLKIDGGFTLN